MPFALAHFRDVLKAAMIVHSKIMARDGLAYRPEWGTKAIVARFKTGLLAMAAFLRSILILMALKMEPELT